MCLRAGLLKPPISSTDACSESQIRGLAVVLAGLRHSKPMCGFRILTGLLFSIKRLQHHSNLTPAVTTLIRDSLPSQTKYFSKARVLKRCRSHSYHCSALRSGHSLMDTSTSPLELVCRYLSHCFGSQEQFLLLQMRASRVKMQQPWNRRPEALSKPILSMASLSLYQSRHKPYLTSPNMMPIL